MTRYYVETERGPAPAVERPAAPACVYAYPDTGVTPISPEYTEVRIVPADAIVIERSELPEVRDHNGGITADPESAAGVRTYYGDALHSRHEALQHLALSEYIAAHPPVDEDAVQELAEAIRAAESPEGILSTNLARALIRAGYAKGGE